MVNNHLHASVDLTPEKELLVSTEEVWLVGPKAGLDVVVKSKILAPPGDRTPVVRSVPQSFYWLSPPGSTLFTFLVGSTQACLGRGHILHVGMVVIFHFSKRSHDTSRAVLPLEDNGMQKSTFTCFKSRSSGLCPWRWRQQGPPKLWYPTATLQGVTTQKTSTWIFTDVWTSDLALAILLEHETSISLQYDNQFH